MNNRVKNVLLLVLVVGLVGMTSAYALLSQRLEINSTATVKGSTLDVHFVQESLSQPILAGQAEVTTAPSLSATTLDELDVTLTTPGDSVSYTFDISNAGSIDAKISEYKINQNGDGIVCTGNGSSAQTDADTVCNGLTYTLTYAENTTEEQTENVITAGTAVAQDQVLKAESTVKVKLTISFNGTTVPKDDVTITGLDAYMIYAQD